MKQITLFTAALLTFAGMQAQNSIDQVLRNIEANNKELQANARLISSQKLEAKTDNNLAVLPSPTHTCGDQRTRVKQSVNSLFRRVSTFPVSMPAGQN